MFKVFTVAGRGINLFFWHGLIRPLWWLSRSSFNWLLLPIYRRYRVIKQRIKTHPRFAGIRSLGHFFQRYAVYLALVTLGIFTVSNNLFARTIRPDELGSRSVWSSLIQNPLSDLIVETDTGRQTAERVDVLAVGGPSPVAAVKVTDLESTADPLVVATTVGGIGGAETGSAAVRTAVEEYVVEGGDTISSIAANFSLGSKTVLWANGLGDNDFIRPGQKLKIPAQDGVLHEVKSGDTVASIARKYGAEEQKILSANNILMAEAIQPGDQLIVPGGAPPAPPSAPAPSRTLIGGVFDRSQAPPSAPATSARFRWPTSTRRINQYYRGRWHAGIDIDGNYGTPIYAAASGRVTYASADRSGYGLHVVIDHGNGYSTLYGHASKIFVGSGQYVNQGQTIATQGCTGRCTGVHLHFEIRIGGGAVNPLGYF